MLVVVAAGTLALTGCTTPREQDGVIIEQRRWWHIFSETGPVEETGDGEVAS